MKVLVTGDKGYIGSVLMPLLIKEGYEVVGFDANFFNSTLDSSRLAKYANITKDIRDISEKDMDGVDVIIHLSAISNDPMGEINPGLTMDVNFKASTRLAKIAKKMGVKKFIFSSSCSIYGIAINGVVDEVSEVNPLTTYAKSKIQTENELKMLSDNNFCVGLLRNSTVYGYSPKFRNDLVVNNLVTSALAFGQIRIMSDGTPWRPLIDVRDLSRIFVEFVKAPSEKINANVFNIGFKENNFQVKDIVSEIKRHLPKCEVAYTGEHGADTRSYKVNFDKFTRSFPIIQQKWNLRKSIGDLIKHLKKIKFSEKDFAQGNFTRIVVLKDLISTGKINGELRWV